MERRKWIAPGDGLMLSAAGRSERFTHDNGDEQLFAHRASGEWDADGNAGIQCDCISASPFFPLAEFHNGNINVPYTANINNVVSGGTGSYTWSVVSGSLPARG